MIPHTWLNKLSSHLNSYKFKVKFVVLRFFHRERKCYNVFGDTTSYTIVWQMLLDKWIFSWITLNGNAKYERCKKSTVFSNFHGLHKLRQRWISDQDSSLLELLWNVKHILCRTYSFIPSGYKPKNLSIKVCCILLCANRILLCVRIHKQPNKMRIEYINNSVSNPYIYCLWLLSMCYH